MEAFRNLLPESVILTYSHTSSEVDLQNLDYATCKNEELDHISKTISDHSTSCDDKQFIEIPIKNYKEFRRKLSHLEYKTDRAILK